MWMLGILFPRGIAGHMVDMLSETNKLSCQGAGEHAIWRRDLAYHALASVGSSARDQKTVFQKLEAEYPTKNTFPYRIRTYYGDMCKIPSNSRVDHE